jgi:hypothetical protein
MAETRATCWRAIAGPELNSRSFRAATVPDGPELDGWSDGAVERAEVNNRQLLVKHFAKPARPKTTATAPTKTTATIVDPPRVAALIESIPDDLSIPPFLKRGPKS